MKQYPQVTIHLDKTNWKLLREQKRTLVNGMTDMPMRYLDAIDGIINWIDDIQDQAALQIGEKKVFGRLK